MYSVDLEFDEQGRRRPEPMPGTEFIVECDTVLGAIGQGPDLSWIDSEPEEIKAGLEVDRRGNLVAEEHIFRTNVPKIFASGDVRTGAATVVEAIGEGRRASYAMDYWLRGHDLDDPQVRRIVTEPQPNFLTIVPFTDDVKEPQAIMGKLGAEARRDEDFERIQSLTRALAFHGSGHVLHSLYWHSMSPQGGGDPEGELATALQAGFGSIDGFRKHFAAASKAAEASGWGILAFEPFGRRLVVTAAESHEQMALQGAIPLLVCDVWEHAYYLKYRDRRAEYVDGFMDVIHWGFAEKRLVEATRRLGEKTADAGARSANR